MIHKEISIAILSRKESITVMDVVTSLRKDLESKEFKVYSDETSMKDYANWSKVIEDVKKMSPDYIVSVGGDGTLLWVFRSMDDETPVLALNVGGRGILSEISPNNIGKSIKQLQEKQYLIDSRNRISVSVNGKTLPPALNEVYVNRISQTRTSTYTMTIGGYKVKQRMDGLMVSTSTGSTGHSLSFGGPYIHPDSAVFLVLMVGSIDRLPPIVLPTKPIEVISDHDSSVTVDGQEEILVKASEQIVITKHNRDARFVRFENKGFQQLEKIFL
ncbi:MAG: NAD(+)/NADH kinase [Nitrososphaerales archaeon]|nr:NAD(+)/NADH kinase [Nitrososphaerales archaeon]